MKVKGTLLFSLVAVTIVVDVGYMSVARSANTPGLLALCVVMDLLCAIPALSFLEWAKTLPNRTQWLAVGYVVFFAALSAFFIASDQRVFVKLFMNLIAPTPRY